jgi:hypothetical protein
MFQTPSPYAGDAIHPVLLGRVWLVRLPYPKVHRRRWTPPNFSVGIYLVCMLSTHTFYSQNFAQFFLVPIIHICSIVITCNYYCQYKVVCWENTFSAAVISNIPPLLCSFYRIRSCLPLWLWCRPQAISCCQHKGVCMVEVMMHAWCSPHLPQALIYLNCWKWLFYLLIITVFLLQHAASDEGTDTWHSTLATAMPH